MTLHDRISNVIEREVNKWCASVFRNMVTMTAPNQIRIDNCLSNGIGNFSMVGNIIPNWDTSLGCWVSKDFHLFFKGSRTSIYNPANIILFNRNNYIIFNTYVHGSINHDRIMITQEHTIGKNGHYSKICYFELVSHNFTKEEWLLTEMAF